MKLINFQGLNCYFNCIISVAAFLGVNYEESFAALWSETDFAYERNYDFCSTKRMFTSLESLGAKRKILSFSSKQEAAESLSLFQTGEVVIVGMDAFHIPWSPIYRLIYDNHYFFARKEEGELFSCFDPTYDKKNMQLTHDYIVSHAFDICYMEKVVQKPLSISIREEACEIIRRHPQTQEKLLWEINECTHEKKKNAVFLGKYADALVNNRYLYKHYLQNVPSGGDKYRQFFDNKFFSRWIAVKNGLYKISLLKNNESLINEVCCLFNGLIAEEVAIAEQIMAI